MAFADDSVIESLDPEPGSVEEFYLLVGTLISNINVSKPNGKASFYFQKEASTLFCRFYPWASC